MARQYDGLMADVSKERPELKRLWRAVIEVAFIIFLFYSNLLMGEFTASRRPVRTLWAALQDIFTVQNFTIAILTAIVGYVIFEGLRKRLKGRE